MNLNLVIIVKTNISNTSTKEKQTARQFFAANLAPPNGHEGGGDGGRERGKRRGKERLNEKEDCEPFFWWEKGPVAVGDSRVESRDCMLENKMMYYTLAYSERGEKIFESKHLSRDRR